MSARPSDRQPPASTALVIFAKAPIPGQVKTRLCPALTEDEAATLHGSFVLDTLERTKAAVSRWKLPVDRFLACAPSSTHVFFRIMEARHGVTLLDQEGDDLGMRMRQAFNALFTRGYRQVCLVGTDVPSLPLTHYRDAVESLTRHDLVLGPAQDGGVLPDRDDDTSSSPVRGYSLVHGSGAGADATEGGSRRTEPRIAADLERCGYHRRPPAPDRGLRGG
jgi:rSAM/selenodomain-associated transferase 1